jgi:hypothetical protein
MTRKTLRTITLAFVTLVGLVVAAAGCSTEPRDTVRPSSQSAPRGANSGSSAEDTGSISMNLTLPAGQAIEAFAWTITGPNRAVTPVQSGFVDVTKSQAPRFLVANLPTASGYTVSLSGAASDGSVVCSGSATFDVAPRTTTPVAVVLPCVVATSGAHVVLSSGSSFNCAAVSGASATPATIAVGSSIQLAATAAGPDANALSYRWSAPGGSIDTPNAANARFTCSTPGSVPVALTVSDGPVPAGHTCSTTLASKVVQVTCTATQPPPAPAMPAWAVAALGVALMALGSGARRRDPG